MGVTIHRTCFPKKSTVQSSKIISLPRHVVKSLKSNSEPSFVNWNAVLKSHSALKLVTDIDELKRIYIQKTLTFGFGAV